MSGSGALKRSQHLAIRCYKLRQQGYSLSEISDMTGVDKEKVNSRIKLGQRLEELEGD